MFIRALMLQAISIQIQLSGFKKRGTSCYGQTFVHNFEAVIATGLKPRYFNHTPPTSGFWVWQLQELHAVKNWPLYTSLWSSTIPGKNIATIGLKWKCWSAYKLRKKPEALCVFE